MCTPVGNKWGPQRCVERATGLPEDWEQDAVDIRSSIRVRDAEDAVLGVQA
mgnify:CR=1 FL=1